MLDLSLLESYFVTMAVLLIMAIMCFFCCMCMRLSDLRMQRRLQETARRKGIAIDWNRLDPNNVGQYPENEVCTIMMPEVGVAF